MGTRTRVPEVTGSEMAPRDEYLLGYRRAEQERLQEQARQLADESSWLFDQFAIPSGARVVEIGCGPQGCLDLEDRPLVHVYPLGHGRRTILLDFVENLSSRLVETGLVDPDELEALKRSLSQHLDDPNTVVVSHLFVQAWGRKR